MLVEKKRLYPTISYKSYVRLLQSYYKTEYDLKNERKKQKTKKTSNLLVARDR